jgi:hypothetical protein
MKRFVVVALGSAALTMAIAAPSGAAVPEGRCAPGWQLISTEGDEFLQDLDAKGNADEFICFRPAAGANPLGHRGTVVDNRRPV